MDVVCDINVAIKIVGWFRSHGLEAIFAADLMGTDDDADLKIARLADMLDALVVTKDQTFVHIIRGKQVPSKILVLDDQNTRKNDLIKGLTPHLEVIRAAATNSGVGCFMQYSKDGTLSVQTFN